VRGKVRSTGDSVPRAVNPEALICFSYVSCTRGLSQVKDAVVKCHSDEDKCRYWSGQKKRQSKSTVVRKDSAAEPTCAEYPLTPLTNDLYW
jgi:hypothetical protein